MWVGGFSELVGIRSFSTCQDVEESEEEEEIEEADDAQTKSKKKSLNKAERLGYS